MSKIEYLDLGMQPIANDFVVPEQDKAELFFRLAIGVDEVTGMSSLMQIVDSRTVYTDTYAYHSSGSQTMRDHFAHAATILQEKWNPKTVLEIGSNDGVFLKNFKTSHNLVEMVGVEPCANFAMMTTDIGINTICAFWNQDAADKVASYLSRKVDLIYSANCICHIPDLVETFDAVKNILSDDGVFVFEDPSLLNMFKRGSYDQIYVEHVHMFTVCALERILKKCGLEIIAVQPLAIHGGSNRITVAHKDKHHIDPYVIEAKTDEVAAGLDLMTPEFHAEELIGYAARDNVYCAFERRAEANKERLLRKLFVLKEDGKKVISYGATAKSTTVFNYCDIDDTLISYIIDNTKSKQNKLSPGMHIPIVAPEINGILEDVDVAFLGAWNFEKEICNKESQFLSRGGVFITHVPQVREIDLEYIT